MIHAAYARTMAQYNRLMNHAIYAAAGKLTNEQRLAECDVFWSSLQGTLCHLYWGDAMWMSRFAGLPRPDAGLQDSAQYIDDFSDLAAQRIKLDDVITAWADNLTDEWLEDTMSWFSAASNRQVTATRSLLVTHMFNHQTHHRGQAHALLTRFGVNPGDTDLFILVPRL